VRRSPGRTRRCRPDEPGGWHSRCVVSTSGAGRSTTPESVGYSLKRLLLGKPLVTEQLKSERLSNPVALGVLSPDAISSSAYGTEEILIELLPYAGLAAFTLVLPITGVILVILVLVAGSYRQVVMIYTRAGGSYVVARENFGPRVAQIAAAVIGSRFGTELLTSLGVEQVVDELVTAQLIDQVKFTRRPEYVFHHPLIRTVAYEAQLRSDRAELHRRLAAAIQQRDPDSLDENAALIAEHLQAAGELRAADGVILFPPVVGSDSTVAQSTRTGTDTVVDPFQTAVSVMHPSGDIVEITIDGVLDLLALGAENTAYQVTSTDTGTAAVTVSTVAIA
jgi:hypothetical protein